MKAVRLQPVTRPKRMSIWRSHAISCRRDRPRAALGSTGCTHIHARGIFRLHVRYTVCTAWNCPLQWLVEDVLRYPQPGQGAGVGQLIGLVPSAGAASSRSASVVCNDFYVRFMNEKPNHAVLRGMRPLIFKTLVHASWYSSKIDLNDFFPVFCDE